MGEEGMRRFSVEFHPIKWRVRGQHHPAIGYTLPAPSAEAEKARWYADRLVAALQKVKQS